MNSKIRIVGITTIITALTTLLLDLLWLGVVAKPVYNSLLGSLKRPEVYWLPALMFYLMYLIVTLQYAVFSTTTIAAAARHGAALGAVAYATYELTNWAVLRDWPALLVPIDIAWGVVLTATASAVGKFVHLKTQNR